MDVVSNKVPFEPVAWAIVLVLRTNKGKFKISLRELHEGGYTTLLYAKSKHYILHIAINVIDCNGILEHDPHCCTSSSNDSLDYMTIAYQHVVQKLLYIDRHHHLQHNLCVKPISKALHVQNF